MAQTTPLHEQTAAAGAVLGERFGWQVPLHFGDPRGEYEAARSTAALFDVSPRGKIEAEGTDAVVFLHNISTADVKGLPAGSGWEVFFCTATAKVVGHGWVYRAAPDGKRERLWLDVDDGQGEKLFRHLDHYIIGEDVTLTDHTAELAQMHLAGPDAARLLREVLSGITAESVPGSFVVAEVPGKARVQVRYTRPLGWESFELLCPGETAGELWQRLVGAGARPTGREAWEVLRIEAGLPVFGIDIDDSTFAPETGRMEAISYQKGCYLGQEPIVMARDRGVVQRTLMGLLVGDEPATAGSLLYRDNKEVGRVTSSVFSPRLGCAVALSYLKRGSQTPGMELQMDTGGVRRAVKVAKLPFSG
jgi:folate-binding protein YgfZ